MEIQIFKTLPSKLAKCIGKVFHEYPIYTVALPSNIIDQYLPNRLDAFVSSTFINFSKRYFFYSKPVLYSCQSQISGYVEKLPDTITLKTLLEDLLPIDDSKIRYSFVITNDWLIFTRIPRLRHVSHHLLCKHIVLSNRSSNVRYAGEFWRDENCNFQLNNNSGTYKPSDILIDPVVQFFNHLEPELKFQGITFRISAPPSTKRRILNKVVKRLPKRHDQQFAYKLNTI